MEDLSGWTQKANFEKKQMVCFLDNSLLNDGT